MNARDETYFARERGEAVSDEPAPEEEAEPIEMFRRRGLRGARDRGDDGRGTAAPHAADPERAEPRRDAGLADDDVLEVTCMTDEHGSHPLAQGRMLPAARALIEPLKAFERLTVDAAISGSHDSALKALLVHPLVGSFEVARSILDDYLSAHAEFLGYVTR